jgi:hypothetical protein
MLQSPNDPSVRITDFRTLAGGKYAECNQTDVYFALEKVRAARGEPPMRGLDPNRREYLLDGPRYVYFVPDGKTFMVKVSFNQRPSDDVAQLRRGDTTPGISQQDRIVVEATIHSNGSVP